MASCSTVEEESVVPTLASESRKTYLDQYARVAKDDREDAEPCEALKVEPDSTHRALPKVPPLLNACLLRR